MPPSLVSRKRLQSGDVIRNQAVTSAKFQKGEVADKIRVCAVVVGSP